MLEGGGRKVGVEFPVQPVEDVAVEGGGHPGRVVVGRFEAVDGLHQVGAEQERVARLEVGHDLGEEHRPLLGGEVPDGAAQKGDHPPPSAGQEAEVALEVADDGVDGHPRVLGGHGLGSRA